MARGAKPLTLIDTDEFGTLLTQWNVVSGPDRGRPQVDGRRPVQDDGVFKAHRTTLGYHPRCATVSRL